MQGTHAVDSTQGGDGWALTWVGRMEPSRMCRLRCSRGADIFNISPLLFTEEPWAGGERHGCEGSGLRYGCAEQPSPTLPPLGLTGLSQSFPPTALRGSSRDHPVPSQML